MFLVLGLLLGDGVFGVLSIDPDDPFLEAVATLALALVLFLDGVKLQVHEVGKRWVIPVLILGPGTGLIIVFGAVPLALLLGFGWVLAFIGGAILASTDPVVLREIIRDERIPRPVRQILRIEAGTNDVVVLPVILVLIAVAGSEVGGASEWVRFGAQLLLLGPPIGFAIGGLGSRLMTEVDSRLGIRREHQALYGIGLVLAAYSASTAAGGDGFLASFAAGLAVVLLNQRLCDCFLEYGEITSEMGMLLAFVLFGAVLSSIIDTVDLWPALALAGLVILVIRPAVLGLVLSRARMSLQAHAFVSWFGPRGLNSLLLALLVVLDEVADAELLLATVGVVVPASVTVHSASATPFSAWYSRRAARETLVEERENSAVGLFVHDGSQAPRMTPEGLNDLLQGQTPPVVLDVRSRSSYERAVGQIPGSVRVVPDRVTELTEDWPSDRLIVTYCT